MYHHTWTKNVLKLIRVFATLKGRPCTSKEGSGSVLCFGTERVSGSVPNEKDPHVTTQITLIPPFIVIFPPKPKNHRILKLKGKFGSSYYRFKS
jgi:hypothetical protein